MQGPRIESLTNGVPNLVDLGGIYICIYIYLIYFLMRVITSVEFKACTSAFPGGPVVKNLPANAGNKD